MQSKLEDFIINDHKNDFGNWDNIIDDIFAFKDYEGSKRVSRLVKNLFNNLKYNNKNESIKKTANYYGSNYGEEKIFKTIWKYHSKINKIVIITWSNGYLGSEISKNFLKLGANVINRYYLKKN